MRQDGLKAERPGMGKHVTSTAARRPVHVLTGDTFSVKITWPGTPDKLKVYIIEVPKIPFWANAAWCLLSILKAIFDIKGYVLSIDKKGHVKILWPIKLFGEKGSK